RDHVAIRLIRYGFAHVTRGLRINSTGAIWEGNCYAVSLPNRAGTLSEQTLGGVCGTVSPYRQLPEARLYSCKVFSSAAFIFSGAKATASVCKVKADFASSLRK
ncbi:MAG: hypothetical protein ACI89E_002023, partial [Planctomycetota bacterium]